MIKILTILGALFLTGWLVAVVLAIFVDIRDYKERKRQRTHQV